jgi:hypothetical protein
VIQVTIKICVLFYFSFAKLGACLVFSFLARLLCYHCTGDAPVWEEETWQDKEMTVFMLKNFQRFIKKHMYTSHN